jgi:hypothetical protein
LSALIRSKQFVDPDDRFKGEKDLKDLFVQRFPLVKKKQCEQMSL